MFTYVSRLKILLGLFARYKPLHLFIFSIGIWEGAFAENEKIPRTVLLMNTPSHSSEYWYSRAHQFGAMPLEYLGLKVEYVDPREEFLKKEMSPDVLGIVLFAVDLKNRAHALQLIDWLKRAIDGGKKVVVLNASSFDKHLDPTDLSLLNTFYERLGISQLNFSIDLTYSSSLSLKEDPIVNFESEYPSILPPYRPMKLIKDKAISLIDVKEKNLLLSPFTLLSLSPHGGYVADDYGFFVGYASGAEERKWYINPFEFFKRAFHIEETPRPDTTTLAGRRIFYIHIDGDGWNNFTEIARFGREFLSPRVIREEILEKNRDFPFTVGIIGGDIDLDCHGTYKGIEEAKAIVTLSHIEPASHTYSHPFFWGFYEDYSPEKEEPYLSLFSGKTFAKKNFLDRVVDFVLPPKQLGYGASKSYDLDYETALKNKKTLPRAYACHPFNLLEEIEGSIDQVKRLAYPQTAQLIQWSGDCHIFKEALQLAKDLNLENINGGDSRFDAYLPSYAWIRPLCMNQNGLVQPYASMSNENIYTNLWTEKFYAFNELIETLKNTETPIRLRPINLYFHIYSGDKEASLLALKSNISFIRSQTMIPIRTSHFARSVQDFYKVEMEKLGKESFKILNRGVLHTYRFDKALEKGVDFSASKGIVGARHFAGSLYVYLDEKEPEPQITLKRIEIFDREPLEEVPFLIESSHRVWNMLRGEEEWSFMTEGFGNLEMEWSVPHNDQYLITIKDNKGKEHLIKTASLENRLPLHFVVASSEKCQITVKRNPHHEE